jgi:hypothetical protein
LKPEQAKVKALVFDVFGTVVDWRGSVIAEGMVWGKAKDRSCECGGRAQPPRNQANMFSMQPAKFSRRFEQSQDIAEHTCSAVRLTAPSNLSY